MDPREEQKRLAAQRAMTYVEEGSVIGVGTGSTVAYFIDALGAARAGARAFTAGVEGAAACAGGASGIGAGLPSLPDMPGVVWPWPWPC